MSSHLILASALAVFTVALMISITPSWVGTSSSTGQSDLPRALVQTTAGEMLTTQGWAGDFFAGRGDSEPGRVPSFYDRRRDDAARPRSGERRRSGKSGTRRTLCVRLCDGFYWPISDQTTHKGVARDAKQCEQACPGRSRLFVHRNPGEEPAEMRDLGGRPYSKIQNAFRHQREYVADCTCRANPWDEAALARHRGYAEAEQKLKAAATAEKPVTEQQVAKGQVRVNHAQRWAHSGGRDHDDRNAFGHQEKAANSKLTNAAIAPR